MQTVAELGVCLMSLPVSRLEDLTLIMLAVQLHHSPGCMHGILLYDIGGHPATLMPTWELSRCWCGCYNLECTTIVQLQKVNVTRHSFANPLMFGLIAAQVKWQGAGTKEECPASPQATNPFFFYT